MGAFKQLIADLQGSNHEALVNVAESLASLAPESLENFGAAQSGIKAFDALVTSRLPHQTADHYFAWRGRCKGYYISLDRKADRPSPEQKEAFELAISGVVAVWKSLLDLLPLLLAAFLNQVDRDVVRQYAADEFDCAKQTFEKLFINPWRDGRLESEQVNFLNELLAVFRKLEHKGNAVSLLSVVISKASGLAALFPDHFVSALSLLSKMRNAEFHEWMAQRPINELTSVVTLTEACGLVILAPLVRIFGELSLVHIERVDQASRSRATARHFVRSDEGSLIYFSWRQESKSTRAPLRERHTFLIDSAKESGDGGEKNLSAADCLDLTPLLYFDGPISNDTVRRQKGLCFFVNSKESGDVLFFRQLGYEDKFPVTRKDKPSFDGLFDAFDKFTRQFLADEFDTPEAADELFKKTWDISTPHLSGLLDWRQYSPHGLHKEEHAPGSFRFVEKLFEAPDSAQVLEDFMASRKRGLLLVGESGIGKSNLLCNHFLKLRQKGELAIFITARLLKQPALQSILQMEASQSPSSQDSRKLNRDLTNRGQTLTVFLDAVNEYHKPDSGPIDLLNDVVRFVKDGQSLDHVRIIVSCGPQTWSAYQQEYGAAPLDNRFFKGDAIVVGGFEAEEGRKTLYARYQKAYLLRPEKPSPQVHVLIRQPLFMSIIAETYSNIPLDAKGSPGNRRIPAELNYYELFERLTRRKILDASRYMSGPDFRLIEKPMTDALKEFSSLVLKNLMEQRDGRVMESDLPLSFRAVLSRTNVSVLEALIGAGLLQEVPMPYEDHHGVTREGVGYKLFHDIYTQYWLSTVYHVALFDRATPERVISDSRFAQTLETFLIRVRNTPLLSGAVDHWLYRQMTVSKGHSTLLVPLFGRLSRSNSGFVTHYVGAFLVGLVSRDLLTPSELWSAILRADDIELKEVLVDTFLETARDQPRGYLRAFLDAADIDHCAPLLIRAADNFAHLFVSFPAEILSYFHAEVQGVENYKELLPLRKKKDVQHLLFLFHFVPLAILASFESGGSTRLLAEFLRIKYAKLIEVITKSHRIRPAQLVILDITTKLLQDNGARMWDNAVAIQGNDDFFDDKQRPQRRLLRLLYPYLAKVHNGHVEATWLLDGDEFQLIALALLRYRARSIGGYIAATILSQMFRFFPNALEGFVKGLLLDDSDASRFSSYLVLVNSGLIDQTSRPDVMRLIETVVLPRVLADPEENDSDGLGDAAMRDWWIIVGQMAELDLVQHWPVCERCLKQMFQAVSGGKHPQRVRALADALVKGACYPHPEIGLRLAQFLVCAGCLDDAVWRPHLIRIMAALLATHPSSFRELHASLNLPEGMVGEVRHAITKEIRRTKEEVFYEISWNKYLAKELTSNITARGLVFGILVRRGLECKSKKEITRVFAQCVLEMIRALRDPQLAAQYEHLSEASVPDLS